MYLDPCLIRILVSCAGCFVDVGQIGTLRLKHLGLICEVKLEFGREGKAEGE